MKEFVMQKYVLSSIPNIVPIPRVCIIGLSAKKIYETH